MNETEFTMINSLPLEVKVRKTMLRVQEWVDHFGEDGVYISCSGGKDSLVLVYIIRKLMGLKNIPIVYVDSGLEYPDVRENLLREYPDVVIIRPEMKPKDIIKKYGYPVISKANASILYKLNNYKLKPEYRDKLLNGNEKGKVGTLPKKYHSLIGCEVQIGKGCCNVIKKRTFHRYEKETGRVPFTGELAVESNLRKKAYLAEGCNAFQRKLGPKSMPLGFWNTNDVLTMCKKYNIKIPKVYGDIIEDYTDENGQVIYKTTALSRTGCTWCGFGAEFDDRFIRLKEVQPRMYDYIINGGDFNDLGYWEPNEEGLGLGYVLDKLGIKY
ncbi:aminotransferase V [Clostridium phage Clo-PEP-1]|nr:aminotransferase V [Clostridium phage Clo-PEP-1]